MSGLPEFKSSLSYCIVRDFAYPEFHPLHYGAISAALSEDETERENQEQLHEQEQEQDIAPDSIHRRAVALFDFSPENDNETALQEGQVIWVSYRHGQGWLVGENLETGETGLIPEEYVQLLPEEEIGDPEAAPEDGWEDVQEPASSALHGTPSATKADDGPEAEWEDAPDAEERSKELSSTLKNLSIN